MSEATIAPRRRVKVTIELEADSWEDAAKALNGCQLRLFEAHQYGDTKVRVTSGSMTAGWNMDGDEDQAITHKGFVADVDRYLKAKEVERAAADE